MKTCYYRLYIQLARGSGKKGGGRREGSFPYGDNNDKERCLVLGGPEEKGTDENNFANTGFQAKNKIQ